MIRAPGPSKATPQTTCQKCLKKDESPEPITIEHRSLPVPRHYSYECKATAQERPYTTRPSRTQQLANPKLVPKLTSDIPNDLLRKKGIADEQLAKLDRERGRKRSSLSNSPDRAAQRRSRSMSSRSSASTISTNLSRSASPNKKMKFAEDLDRPLYSQQESRGQSLSRKRRRSTSSSSTRSISSDPDTLRRRRDSHRDNEDRNTRRRRSSVSPNARGRNSEHDYSRSQRDSPPRRRDSMDRSRIARHRNSLTPDPSRASGKKGRERDGGEPYKHGNNGYRRQLGGHDRYGGGTRRVHTSTEDSIDNTMQPPPPPVGKRERSLSPFSKRVALTKAMRGGS